MNELEELINRNTKIYPVRVLLTTKKKNYNLDRIKSLNDLNTSLVYNSIVRCLTILERKQTKYKKTIAHI